MENVPFFFWSGFRSARQWSRSDKVRRSVLAVLPGLPSFFLFFFCLLKNGCTWDSGSGAAAGTSAFFCERSESASCASRSMSSKLVWILVAPRPLRAPNCKERQQKKSVVFFSKEKTAIFFIKIGKTR